MIPLEDEHRSRRKNPSKNDTDIVAENLDTVGTSEATSSNNSGQPRKKAASKNPQPTTQNEAAVDPVVNVDENPVTVATSEATLSNNSAQPRKKTASRNPQPTTQNEAAVNSVVCFHKSLSVRNLALNLSCFEQTTKSNLADKIYEKKPPLEYTATE